MVSAEAALADAQRAVLAPALAAYPKWYNARLAGPASYDFPILHALGDKLDFPPDTAGLNGRPDVGVVFFESAVIPAANLEGAKRFALIVTGSTWNTDILARHGFDRTVFCPQGVDLSLFKPVPRVGAFAGRFAVFSGGKLEYRKGQDLVVAAFKRFHSRHPDALLVTAWHSPWTAFAQSVAMSPHVSGLPGVKAAGQLDVAGWLVANGLPADSFVEVGLLPNSAIPSLLQEVDLAIFPNRSEGGTNLVAMECMAMGVPVVLSRNTGHLDLIRSDNCYSLDMQIPVGAVTGRPDLDGWGESSIDELVARMEEAYTDRARAEAIGKAGHAFMQTWDWPTQIERFLKALAAVC
jgi:glycosyltransferase involved in cell wall biosynthesis